MKDAMRCPFQAIYIISYFATPIVPCILPKKSISPPLFLNKASHVLYVKRTYTQTIFDGHCPRGEKNQTVNYKD